MSVSREKKTEPHFSMLWIARVRNEDVVLKPKNLSRYMAWYVIGYFDRLFLGYSSFTADRKLSSTSLAIVYSLIKSFVYQFLASKTNNFEEYGRCGKERASERPLQIKRFWHFLQTNSSFSSVTPKQWKPGKFTSKIDALKARLDNRSNWSSYALSF